MCLQGIKKYPNGKKFGLLLSDGVNLNDFTAVMSEELYNVHENGELGQNSIIKIKKYACLKKNPNNKVCW